jgi:hypothetical protein
MFLYPTLVVILSAIFLGKSPTRREVGALVMTYAGIALVLSQQLGATPEHRMFLFGALLVFASSTCYAVYLVAGSQLVKRVIAAIYGLHDDHLDAARGRAVRAGSPPAPRSELRAGLGLRVYSRFRLHSLPVPWSPSR